MIKGLIALVKQTGPITDLIGTTPVRFYPKLLPQGLTDFPAATFDWYNNRDNDDFGSVSQYDFGYVDLQCYGRTYGESVELWGTMRRELERQTGIYNGVDIREVKYMDSGAEDYLDDLELYAKQLELRVSYFRLYN